MRLLLLLLMTIPLAMPAFAPPALAQVDTVRVPGPDGVVLNAQIYPAQGRVQGAAIVALHGCGGPFPSRDSDWGRRLSALGHTVLMPDSFGSRGLGSQCGTRQRPVTASGLRRQDALAALHWLAARPGTPPGGLVLLGWSDGGSTVLTTGRVAPDLPAGLIRGLVAFYPGCRVPSQTPAWEPAAPLLILMGEADDWTPAAPCHALADRLPGRVTLVTYPGAYHDFDAPNQPTRIRQGLAMARGNTAHTGSDPAGREDAVTRVPAFIAGLPPAP
jgi:dienelactone hydrolase